MVKSFSYEYTDPSIIDEHLIDTVTETSGNIEKIEFDSERAFRIIYRGSQTDIIIINHGKTVQINSCTDGLTSPCRIIGELAKIGVIKSNVLPLSDDPLTLNEDTVEYLGSVMLRKTKPEHPIIYLSTLQDHHNTCGFGIDHDRLAKRLWGLATVVVQGNETVTHRLHKKSKKTEPTNGCVGIYYPNGKYNIITELKLSQQTYTATEDYIAYEIERFHTENCTYGKNTFDSLKLKKLQSELENVRSQERISTPIQTPCPATAEDKRDKQIASLQEENGSLKKENKLLKDTLDQKNKGVLVYPAIEQLRESEFKDLIIAAINYLNQNTPDDCKRKKFLLNAFLSVNSLSDYETRLKKTSMQAFKDDNWKPYTLFSDFKEIEYKGIEGTHYKFNFARWVNFPLSCTPSDSRTRRNEVRDCFRAFCVT